MLCRGITTVKQPCGDGLVQVRRYRDGKLIELRYVCPTPCTVHNRRTAVVLMSRGTLVYWRSPEHQENVAESWRQRHEIEVMW